jgi:hypothetical protein
MQDALELTAVTCVECKGRPLEPEWPSRLVLILNGQDIVCVVLPDL